MVDVDDAFFLFFLFFFFLFYVVGEFIATTISS